MVVINNAIVYIGSELTETYMVQVERDENWLVKSRVFGREAFSGKICSLSSRAHRAIYLIDHMNNSISIMSESICKTPNYHQNFTVKLYRSKLARIECLALW